MAELTSAVILDSGSGFIKAGLAHNDFPTVCAPNILLQTEEQQGSDTVQRLFGKEALKRLGELSAAG
jgi:actin-related protein